MLKESFAASRPAAFVGSVLFAGAGVAGADLTAALVWGAAEAGSEFGRAAELAVPVAGALGGVRAAGAGVESVVSAGVAGRDFSGGAGSAAGVRTTGASRRSARRTNFM